MEIKDCRLAGLKLIHLKLWGDSRGFFVERFHAAHLSEAGIPSHFPQDNHSRSAPGILRGLHYQHTPVQGKLVGVVRGKIFDVVVDIRKNSPTCGQWESFELSDENALLLWIPSGFAHGFCVLGEEPADILYKVTDYYNPAGEGGIRYDDPDLNITWPIAAPTISERDRKLQSWQEYQANPIDWSKP